MSLLVFKGSLVGHNDWVTCISVPSAPGKNIVASGSRDKKVIIWDLDVPNPVEGQVGVAKHALKKHSQPISDIVLSSRGDFVLSASWDKTLRLWDLASMESFRTFTGHTGNVMSVAFSPDNRQIISASCDKTIKLWNTLGQCKFTILENQHTDWISCVRFSPDQEKPLIVTCGWDKLTKVWDLADGTLKCDLVGHVGPVHTVTISPDGSLCASGGKDGIALLWDVNQGNALDKVEAGDPINALCFSPCNYWLCAATDKAIKIWDLETKKVLVELCIEAQPKGVHIIDKSKKKDGVVAYIEEHPRPARFQPWCVSLTWSADGSMLFAGSTNGNIYVFGLARID